MSEVDYFELEAEVSRFYDDLPYSVIAALECGNDTVHAVTVDGYGLDNQDRDDLRQWQKTGEGRDPHPRVVMTEMVRAGAIPAGEYLIRVCW